MSSLRLKRFISDDVACSRQRLATVIFAPNRGSADDHDATELRKLEELVSKRDSFVQLQHARSESHDSARRSWLPVLSEGDERQMQVDVEGLESLAEDSRESYSFSVSPRAMYRIFRSSCSWTLETKYQKRRCPPSSTNSHNHAGIDIWKSAETTEFSSSHISLWLPTGGPVTLGLVVRACWLCANCIRENHNLYELFFLKNGVAMDTCSKNFRGANESSGEVNKKA